MTSKKKIWIINQYASTPDTGMGGRHYYLAQELAALGHDVCVVAASESHLLRESRQFSSEFLIEKYEGFRFIWVKVPKYLQAHSRQRVLNWFTVSNKVEKLPELLQDKPDVVYLSSPALVCIWGARKLAKKTGAKLVFEVRDIWPLTLIHLGNYSRWHPFVMYLQRLEDFAYKKADYVFSNLKNAVEHMKSRGLDERKFSWIPNGFSLSEVSQKIPLPLELETQIPKDRFIVGYTGTIGVANCLDSLVLAAEILKDEEKIFFVVVGEGKEKPHVMKMAQEKGLKNILFLDPIHKSLIPAMLEKFDACFIAWKDVALYRFGIGANKIPEYLQSARPIIHAYSGACDPITEYGAGITVPAEDHQAMAQAITKIHQMSPEERAQMGARGHQAALDHYEYSSLAAKLSSIFS